MQKEKKEIQNNPFLFLITLVLITIPLHYRYSNIAIILLSLYSIYKFNKRQFQIQKALVLPILLYLLMVISLLWTIDFQATSRALLKGLSLFLIPVCFFINPPLTNEERNKIVCYFSYAIFGFSLFYTINALIRFIITKDTKVFFYHELVTFDVNAIHFSVFVCIAIFWFFLKKEKSITDKVILLLLFFLLILLSSKNIIVLFLFLVLLYILKVNKIKKYLILFLVIGVGLLFSGKIKDRFSIEIESNNTENSVNKEISSSNGIVYNVSIKEAWTKEKFELNDYFPGTAMRVYQARIFKEMLTEDKSYLTGYGLNATLEKIKQKRIEHNLYPDYEKFNFHNQYFQLFAEIGLVGFVLLVLMLITNLKNAIKTKYFIHFSFAVLMISLFLTESYLSRQRGIVFFTMLYCLFNSTIQIKDSIKEQQ